MPTKRPREAEVLEFPEPRPTTASERLPDDARSSLERNTQLVECDHRPGRRVSYGIQGARAYGFLSDKKELDVLLVHVDEQSHGHSLELDVLRGLIEHSGARSACVRIQESLRDHRSMYEAAGFVVSQAADDGTLTGSWEPARPPVWRRVDLTPASYVLEGTLPAWLRASDFDQLWALRPTEPSQIRLYGKVYDVPRRQRSYGRDYKFAGTSHPAASMPASLQAFMRWSGTLELGEFDQLMVNWYADGNDCIAAHADDQPQLQVGAPIVTVSLGATRTFRIRDGATRKMVRDVPATHGKVLVMCGAFQQELKHEVPRTARVLAPRISLTFRQFVPE